MRYSTARCSVAQRCVVQPSADQPCAARSGTRVCTVMWHTAAQVERSVVLSQVASGRATPRRGR
eukprot:10651856-Lingulodinium_polyedra.AAC.1